MGLVKFADEESNLRSHDFFEWLPSRGNDVYRNSSCTQRSGNFQTDKAGAYDQHSSRGSCFGNDSLAVSKGAEIMDLGLGRAGNWQMDRVGSGGEQKRAKFDRFSLFDDYLFSFCIQRRNLRIEEKINLPLAVVIRRPQRNPVLLCRAGQIVLGKIRTIHRWRVVGTYDREGPSITFPPQHVRRRQTGSASAYDHNRTWSIRRTFGSRRREFLTNENLVAETFNPPTGNGVKGRRPQRLTCTQTETGMVPRTAHCVVNHQPIGERAVIVRAVRTDCKQLCATAHHQDVFSIDDARELPMVRDPGNGNSTLQVKFFNVIHIQPHSAYSILLRSAGRLAPQRRGWLTVGASLLTLLELDAAMPSPRNEDTQSSSANSPSNKFDITGFLSDSLPGRHLFHRLIEDELPITYVDPLIELPTNLLKTSHLVESQLFMKGHTRLIRKGDSSDNHMQPFLAQIIQHRAIESCADPPANAPTTQVDGGFD